MIGILERTKYMVESTSKLEKAAMKRLLERDVTLEEITELVYDLQEPYLDKLTMELCLDNVKAVLRKREVQNAVLTGIELDVLTEEGKLASPLQEIIKNDKELYVIDEILVIVNINV